MHKMVNFGIPPLNISEMMKPVIEEKKQHHQPMEPMIKKVPRIETVLKKTGTPMTIQDMARALKKHPRTVQDWVWAGIKAGRIVEAKPRVADSKAARNRKYYALPGEG